jgi:hypothetical protein
MGDPNNTSKGFGRFVRIWMLRSLLKMLFCANAFEISNIQEAQTDGPLTRRSECNNVALR